MLHSGFAAGVAVGFAPTRVRDTSRPVSRTNTRMGWPPFEDAARRGEVFTAHDPHATPRPEAPEATLRPPVARLPCTPIASSIPTFHRLVVPPGGQEHPNPT